MNVIVAYMTSLHITHRLHEKSLGCLFLQPHLQHVGYESHVAEVLKAKDTGSFEYTITTQGGQEKNTREKDR